jgi:N-acetylneuraminic acid mutarotase
MKRLIIILTGAVAFFLSCNKEETSDRDYPRLNTLEVTDVSSDGATFQGEIFYNRNFEIKKYGFVWSENSNPTVQGSDRVEIVGAPPGQKFSSRISTTLQKDVEYKVRAFIITDRYTVYGQEESFMSLGSRAPEIISFEPLIAGWFDTVQIHGKNFSRLIFSNKIFFGNEQANLVVSPNHQNSDSLLYVTVPTLLKASKALISIRLAGNSYIYLQDSFSLKLPYITTITPETGTWKDEIEIHGYFPARNQIPCSVTFDNIESVISYSNDSVLKVVVPLLLDAVSSTPTFKINGMTFQHTGRFRLLPPEIISITPDIWWKNAAVEIKVKNTKANKTTIKMGNVGLPIGSHNTAGTLHSLLVYAPTNQNSGVYPVKVTVLGQTHELSNPITYVDPKITSVYPSEGTYLDTLTIYGDFRGAVSSIEVTLGPTNYLNTIFFNDTAITVVVPTNIGYYDGRVIVRGPWGIIERSNLFRMLRPTISNITVSEPKFGGIVTVTGNNFNPSPLPQNQKLLLNDEDVNTAISFSKTELVFSLGHSFASAKTFKLSDIYGQITTAFSINFASPFSNRSQVYIQEPFSGYGFHGIIGDMGYVGSYNSIYRYNPNSRTWTKRIDLPNRIMYPSFFSLQDKLFYVSGQLYDQFTTEVNEYNPATNTIVEKSPFPGTPRRCGYGFTIGDKGYIAGGSKADWSTLNDFWEYDPNTDSWTQLQNLPYSNVSSVYPTVFVIDDKAYLLATGSNGYASFWCYSPTLNTWETKTTLPDQTGFFPTAFVIENEGYIVQGGNAPFSTSSSGNAFIYKYNPVANSWVQKYKYIGAKANSVVSFVFDNKAHLGMGSTGNSWGYYPSFFVYNPLLDN